MHSKLLHGAAVIAALAAAEAPEIIPEGTPIGVARARKGVSFRQLFEPQKAITDSNRHHTGDRNPMGSPEHLDALMRAQAKRERRAAKRKGTT